MTDEIPIETEARKLFAGACDFIAGVQKPPQLLEFSWSLPEAGFVGRSNVGKSSLVNALTGRKTLARVSHTPGRTQQLNFFDLGGQLMMVDMPGYGFAKVSKQMREDWDDLIFTYLRDQKTLRCVFVLIDSRHGIKPVDLEVMDLLDNAGVSYRIVLTKIDKAEALEKITEETTLALKKRAAAFPVIYATSAEAGLGIDALRTAVLQAVSGR
jgi:GTP-binding protein